jgi:polysaccharide pyruvyl transferase WcaK-like protein
MARKKIAVFNDTRRTSHYGCEYVMQHIVEELQRRDVAVVFTWPVGYDWRTAPDIMERLAGVDGVIVNGEGSIHHSENNVRAQYLTDIAKTVKSRYAIPVHLINASLFSLGEDTFRSLRHFDLIRVRESGSKHVLDAQGIPSEIVPDLTFIVDADRVVQPTSRILATDSVLSAVAQELKVVAAEKGWDYCKFTHASWPLLRDGWPAREYLRRSAKWLYASVLGKNIKNRFEFLHFLMSHGLLCTGRFHAVTLAMATTTPFVALESNTPKITCLLQDVFGSTERLVDMATVGRISSAQEYGWRREELARLSAYVASAKVRATEQFDEICRSL